MNAASKSCLRLARPLPVEVEARQRPARVPGAPARRRRARGRAASSAPSASRRRRRPRPTRRSRAGRRRGSRSRRRRTSAPASFAAAASAANVGDDAGRRLGMRQQHDPRLALGEPRGEVVRRTASRPTRTRAGRPRSRSAPAIAAQRSPNAPAVTTQTRSPGEQRFDERRLHRAGAARGEEEHLVLGAEDLLQPRRACARRRRGSRGRGGGRIGSAVAASTSGGTGVGPGVNR